MILREEPWCGQGPCPWAFRRDLDSIHVATQHLADLIGDVLDLASSQAGELRLIARPFRPARRCGSRSARLARPMAQARAACAWRSRSPGGAARSSGAIKPGCGRWPLNLVINAMKFTELAVRDPAGTGPGSFDRHGACQRYRGWASRGGRTGDDL